MRTWGPAALVVVVLPLAFVLLRSCAPPIGPRHAPEPSVGAAEPHAAGSRACAQCHAVEAAAWEASTHASAESPVPGDVPWTVALGDAPAPAPVRAIGVSPLVQFLVPFPRGRLQVTQQAWDPAAREWFDVFADGRAAGEWGHWTGGGMTWNSQCATCHSTGVSVGYDAAADAYRTTVVETGVGCGGCHGDVGAHAAGGAPPTVAAADTCAACHARRAELTGAWTPGQPFLDHFAPQLVDSTDAFWPDGQVRGEDFEYTAFLGSRMYQVGVRCTSCHDPHSGRTLAEGDALCQSCHAQTTAPHDPHAATVGCVGCHMPVTTYMQRDPRHDHGFTVPDPALHVEFGIPDACTRCHTDRDAAWAAGVAAKWWPKGGGARRARATALARGHAGEADAVPGLLAVATGDNVGFRAAAVNLLGERVDAPEVRAALVSALSDPEGVVRFAAAGALGGAAGEPAVGAALDGALADPVRAVRVAAARSLRGRLAPQDPRAADYVAYLAHNADSPTALHERGTWALERGEVPAAVADLRAAVARDPRSAGVREALALALARGGDARGAAEQLRLAVELAPDDGGLWYHLGLAEAGVGDLAAAEGALAHAVERDPADARAWYNLGLVRQQLGRDALDTLRRAESLAPRDADLAYAVASALWQSGRTEPAKTQARRVLALAPGHPGALAMLAGG